VRLLLVIGPVALAFLWTALMWRFRALMVEPYPRVVRWSRAMNIDPNDSQWFAQLLDDSQVAIRLLIVLLWALGMVAIAVLAALVARGED